jgi:iron complex outermembrane receptor protein
VFSFAGNHLPYAPEYQLTLAYQHSFSLNGGAKVVPRIKASFYDEMFLGWENRGNRPAGTLSPTDPGESDFDVQPAYSKIDLSLAYEAVNDQWTAELFVTNATDESVKTEAFYGGPRTFYKWGDPRIAGIRVAFRYK